MNLKNRKIAQFRCNISPMIGPKPKNAYDLRDMPNCEFELTPAGVYVKAVFQTPGGPAQTQEHLIPFANVQSIKFVPEDDATNEKDSAND